MASATGTIDIKVPVETVYNQWTQFEEFPSIMTGVDDVEQIDDTHLRWRQSVGGREKEWIAEITEQVPDKTISWRSIAGDEARGRVTFHEISPDETRVELRLEYEPEGLMEKGGSVIGVDDARVQDDLRKFKEFIEERGTETGAWRGTVGDGP